MGALCLAAVGLILIAALMYGVGVGRNEPKKRK